MSKEKLYDDAISILYDDPDIMSLMDEDGNIIVDDPFVKEWKDIKVEIAKINKEYAGNTYEKKQAISSLRKKYLEKIASLEDDSSEYEFYKTVLEYLGIDSYTIEYELEQIGKTRSR